MLFHLFCKRCRLGRTYTYMFNRELNQKHTTGTHIVDNAHRTLMQRHKVAYQAQANTATR